MAGRRLLILVIALILGRAERALGQQESSPRLDLFGDPLPVGALARLGTVRFHHAQFAAYSPDGKMLATADSVELGLWDATSFQRIRTLPTNPDFRVAGLLFSHNSKKLALIEWGGCSVEVWDLETLEKRVFTQTEGGSGGEDWSNAAAFSADDTKVFAGTSQALFTWDAASGKKLRERPLRVGGRPVRVRLIAFAQDGTLAATQEEGKVRLWDTRTGKLLHEIELGSPGADTLKFSPDGRILVIPPGLGHWIKIYDTKTGKKLPSLAVTERVVSVAFSADGTTLAVASNEAEGDQVIQLWDVANLKTPAVNHPARGIHFVTISPDGKTLAWGCHEQSLCFMDRATGNDLRPSASHRGAIKSLAWLPDGERVVSAGDDSTLRVWNATTGQMLTVLKGHTGEVLGMALYPNGKLLASCGRDATLRLWDLETGKSLAVLKDEGNWVVAAAFSADGKQLASGGNRGHLFLRDPATGKILHEIKAGPIASLAFSPDGSTIATASHVRPVLLLFDVVTKLVKKVPVPPGGSSVAYSPDGKMLAVGCDEKLLLLDTGSNRVLKTLPGHYNRRGGVAFSPDGRYLASVSEALAGKVDRFDHLPGFIGSSVDGQRVLLQAQKDSMPSYAVLKLSAIKGKDPGKRDYNREREFLWKDGKEVSAALSPDGQTVVLAGDDIVSFIDVITGQERRYRHPTSVVPGSIFGIQSVKFALDGSRVALAGSAGKIRVVSVKDGRRITEWAAGSHNLTGLAFSPDGQTLLTTSFTMPVYVWEVATGQMLYQLPPTPHVFSPNNRALAGEAEGVKLIDLYSGQVVRDYKVEGNPIGNSTFSPNGKLLASIGADATILVWPASIGAGKTGTRLDEKAVLAVLEQGKAPEAYAVIGRMIADPETALAIFERRLQPIPKVDGALAEKPELSPEDILHLRAIQALERISTKRARQLLEKLAHGAKASTRTSAAVEALARLER